VPRDPDRACAGASDVGAAHGGGTRAVAHLDIDPLVLREPVADPRPQRMANQVAGAERADTVRSMARDDYRIKIEVEDAGGLLERLGLELGGEAGELARELEKRRLVVSQDGDEVFVYAASRAEAESARSVIQAVLNDLDVSAITGPVERWLADEERWDNEPPDETWEEEELEHGHAPWEVRVQAPSREAARALEERLEADGYPVVRLFNHLVIGASSREDAEALAGRVHGEVEPGGALVWETIPGNPFAVFGGLGGSGTPVG
jgi:hypothetical protein